MLSNRVVDLLICRRHFPAIPELFGNELLQWHQVPPKFVVNPYVPVEVTKDTLR